jgi:hypothetical protein
MLQQDNWELFPIQINAEPQTQTSVARRVHPDGAPDENVPAVDLRATADQLGQQTGNPITAGASGRTAGVDSEAVC